MLGAMRGKAWAIGALLWLGSAATSSVVRADPYHQQSLIVGERALGLGGAFTGVADDPSAVFYNPAGLAQLTESTASASVSLNAFDKREIKNGFRRVIGDQDLTYTSRPTVPLFVSLVKKLGKGGSDGMRRHAIALSTLTREQRELRYDTSIDGIDKGVQDNWRITNADRVQWYGPSYAYRISSKLSFGLSLFLSTQETRHTEDRQTVDEPKKNPDTGFVDTDQVTVTENLLETSAFHGVARLGVLWQPSPALGFGLMLQPPGVPLRQRGRIRDRRISAVLRGDPYATYLDLDHKNLGSDAPLASEARLGVGYRVSEAVLLAADASVYLPNGSKSDPIRAVEPAPYDEEIGQQADPGLFYADEWHRNWGGNGSVGIDLTLSHGLTVRAGLFTDLSSAPAIKKRSYTYSDPDIDRFGGALSVGINNNGYDLTVGASGSYGRGDAYAFDASNAADFSAPYIRTGVEDRTVFVFLSGAKQAVMRVAKQTVQKVEDRRREAELAEEQAQPTVPSQEP